MTRLPVIAAVTAGLLIGVLPPATAAASPATAGSAPSTSNTARVPIGTPISLQVTASNLQTLPTFLRQVDRHR